MGGHKNVKVWENRRQVRENETTSTMHVFIYTSLRLIFPINFWARVSWMDFFSPRIYHRGIFLVVRYVCMKLCAGRIALARLNGMTNENQFYDIVVFSSLLFRFNRKLRECQKWNVRVITIGSLMMRRTKTIPEWKTLNFKKNWKFHQEITGFVIFGKKPSLIISQDCWIVT